MEAWARPPRPGPALRNTDNVSNRRTPYAYIAGLSHSGSTLLAFLLNAHPELVSIGEASRVGDFLPDRWKTHNDLCSCGKPFFYCEFWNRVLAGLAARRYGLQEGDPFDRPEAERAQAQRKWLAFVAAVLDVSGAGGFVDASKVSSYISQLTAHPGLDLKVISLLRDGRGVVSSWMKRLVDTPPEKVVEGWVRQELDRAAWLKPVPADRVLRVRYEDLCASPNETLVKIFTFLQVDPHVDAAAGYKSTAVHHVIGNQMRLTEDEKIVLDETWRTELDPQILDRFAELGGEINARNGYAD